MEAHLQRVEREPAADLDDELAVDDEALERQPAEEGQRLREKAAERLAGLAAQLDRLALLEREAAESVPFRLVLPLAIVVGERLGGARLHRLRVGRQAERSSASGAYCVRRAAHRDDPAAALTRARVARAVGGPSRPMRRFASGGLLVDVLRRKVGQ